MSLQKRTYAPQNTWSCPILDLHMFCWDQSFRNLSRFLILNFRNPSVHFNILWYILLYVSRSFIVSSWSAQFFSNYTFDPWQLLTYMKLFYNGKSAIVQHPVILIGIEPVPLVKPITLSDTFILNHKILCRDHENLQLVRWRREISVSELLITSQPLHGACFRLKNHQKHALSGRPSVRVVLIYANLEWT